MVTWHINEYLDDCPLGWKRFIADLKSRLSSDDRKGFGIEELNRELEQYQARYYGGYHGVLEFHDDACYTLFILKYGGKNEENTEVQVKSNYIEQNKQYWGPEFASLALVDYRPEHDEIAAMGCYTLLYHIADNFRDGEFREEILKMCGVN